MKRIVFYMACLLAIPAAAQPFTPEQVYLTTDKQAYVAGDYVWISAFVLDAGRDGISLSSQSRTCYVELVGQEGTVASVKVSLLEGRGGGVMSLPLSVPTGNYALVAYTGLLGEGVQADASGRAISVFNTTSTARVKDGVRIVEDSAYPKVPSPGVPVSAGMDIGVAPQVDVLSVFPLTLTCPSDASVSVSVYRLDDVAEPEFQPMAAPERATAVRRDLIPSPDGEVLKAHLEGADSGVVAGDIFKIPMISSPGDASDTYLGFRQEDGTYLFYTGNIFGRRDLVCEVPGLDEETDCHLEIEDPFLYPRVKAPGELLLAKGLYSSLAARHRAMLSAGALQIDTLVDWLPVRTSLLLDDERCFRYHLADYTRMPTVQDMVIEFIPELRVRRDGQRRKELLVRMENEVHRPALFGRGALVLLDGTPMTRHENLLAFDADLLSDILIYPDVYQMGSRSYDGVINFITKAGNISTAAFPSQVRIIDFDGVCPPVALKGGTDDRQTLYWHPLTELKGVKPLRLELKAPSYRGLFKVVAEGLTADGKPVRAVRYFETR